MRNGTGTANAVYSGQVSGEHTPAVPVTTSYVTIAPERSDPFSVTNPHGHGLASIASPRNQTAVSGASSRKEKRGYPDIQPNNPLPRLKFTPGYGSPHPACGDVRFKVVCPEDIKHYSRLARYNCHRPACPTCWPGWAARAADDAAGRIEGYRLATGTDYKPRHISFSPPPGTVQDLQDLIDQGNHVMRRFGIQAACVIPHPYRLKHGGPAADSEEIPTRTWSNRYTEALDSPTWRDRVRFSPHIHAMVYGPLPNSEEFEEKSGWTYTNHEEDRGSRGRLGAELRATIYYLLSHAWVQGNNAVVRYWFGMSTRTLGKLDGEPYIKTEPCPVCKAACVQVPPDIVTVEGRVIPVYQDIHNAPVHVVKVKTWEYIVRAKAPPPSNHGSLAGARWKFVGSEPDETKNETLCTTD